jgi:hypothetical protein
MRRLASLEQSGRKQDQQLSWHSLRGDAVYALHDVIGLGPEKLGHYQAPEKRPGQTAESGSLSEVRQQDPKGSIAGGLQRRRMQSSTVSRHAACSSG